MDEATPRRPDPLTDPIRPQDLVELTMPSMEDIWQGVGWDAAPSVTGPSPNPTPSGHKQPVQSAPGRSGQASTDNTTSRQNDQRTSAPDTPAPPHAGALDAATDRGAAHSTPTYGVPTYGAPTYGAPTYGEQTYSGPTYSGPTYSGPTYSGPTYSGPTYGDQPTNGQFHQEQNPWPPHHHGIQHPDVHHPDVHHQVAGTGTAWPTFTDQPPRTGQPTFTEHPVGTDGITVAQLRPPPNQPPAPGSGAQQISATERPAIEVHDLSKTFGDFQAVSGVSFTARRGTVLAVLGPNGAGKTTTVNMLSTLLKPTSGTASVAGHDVVAEPESVRASIMLTGQFAALDESLTGRDNLILFGRLMGLRKKAAVERADVLLADFGLTDAAGRRVREYSGGMRRRIDIACGLVTRPQVVFLDEPTTGLDPRSRREVWDLVRELRNQGVTTLLTTQYLEEADALSDDIVVIDHGRVIAQGTADQLKAQTGPSQYEITPADPDQVPELLELLADLHPHATRDDDAEAVNTVLVTIDEGRDTLVEIVQRTSTAHIRLADVALRRPSLDDVFLSLTGPGVGSTQ